MTRIYFSLLLCVVFCNAANNTTGQCGKNELEQMKCRLQVLEKASRTDDLETENEMLRNELEEIKTLIASLRQVHSGQPIAFTARKRDAKYYVRSTPEVVVFEDVYLNYGHRYDFSSGVFWAPYNATYVFSWTICTEQKARAGTVLMINDEIVAKNWADSREAPKKQDDSATTTVVVHAKANDRIRIEMHDGNFVEGDLWSSFSGWMLSRDNTSS